MTDSQVACPNCGRSVYLRDRHCPGCGVNLAIAAAFAERDFHTPEGYPQDVPITPEILVPRLGDYLVEQGLLSPADLSRALAYQQEIGNQGRVILLGQALRELELISNDELDQAVTVQILQLQSALQQSNRKLEERVRERTSDLEKALNKLTELNQLKSNFIANISHELRTPLTHMRGYLDILAEGGFGEMTPDQRQALGVLQRSEDRLESLIEDLLQFALAVRGELRLDFSSEDIAEIAQQVLQHAAYKANNKQIKLISHISQDLPAVICDREKISWVLNHLLDNAIKFTQSGGRVGIEAEQQGAQVVLAVVDTGIGIPPERIGELFEPFHQLDSAPTRNFGGTGLGLALTSRILQAHQTTISVQSVFQRGSRFAFALPLAPQPSTEQVH